MNKNESKYFKTAVKMDEALLSILEKKEFCYITVKEICVAAGVNRSTFYLHYENTSDLLKETTRYVLDKFLSCFSVSNKSITLDFAGKELDDLIFIKPEYLSPYLTFIKDNQKIFKTALKEFGTMGFDKVYQKMFNYIFNPILSRFDFSEPARPYVIKFYLSGITAIVIEWINNNCLEDINAIILIITECVMGKQRDYE